MDSFLERYSCGDYQAVWHEMRAIGSVREDHPLFDDVSAVVNETMIRVRQNLETLVSNLKVEDYEFVDTNDGSLSPTVPLTTPDERSNEFVAWLESKIGPLPLSLLAWIRIVGDVKLLGNPAFGDSDALVVEFEYYDRNDPDHMAAKSFVENEIDEWKQNVAEFGREETGPFMLPFAPDFWTKINVSGGSPYSIILPADTVDGIVMVNRERLYFTDYLRNCLRDGGFPRLANSRIEAEVSFLSTIKDGLTEF